MLLPFKGRTSAAGFAESRAGCAARPSHRGRSLAGRAFFNHFGLGRGLPPGATASGRAWVRTRTGESCSLAGPGRSFPNPRPGSPGCSAGHPSAPSGPIARTRGPARSRPRPRGARAGGRPSRRLAGPGPGPSARIVLAERPAAPHRRGREEGRGRSWGQRMRRKRRRRRKTASCPAPGRPGRPGASSGPAPRAPLPGGRGPAPALRQLSLRRPPALLRDRPRLPPGRPPGRGASS